MTIIIGLLTAVLLAVFGLVFLASAKAESWLALAVFAACAVAVFTLPVAGWIRLVMTGSDIAVVASVGLIGGAALLWGLHRAGVTERLVQRLSPNR